MGVIWSLQFENTQTENQTVSSLAFGLCDTSPTRGFRMKFDIGKVSRSIRVET